VAAYNVGVAGVVERGEAERDGVQWPDDAFVVVVEYSSTTNSVKFGALEGSPSPHF
jgi:hypothetical protein